MKLSDRSYVYDEAENVWEVMCTEGGCGVKGPPRPTKYEARDAALFDAGFAYTKAHHAICRKCRLEAHIPFACRTGEVGAILAKLGIDVPEVSQPQQGPQKPRRRARKASGDPTPG